MNLPLVLEKNTTPQNWNARREALLALFRSQEYGIRPEVPYEQTERLRSEEYLPKCKAIRQIWDICLKTKQGSLEFPVVLVRPEGTQKVPAVLFLCNHEKTASPGPKMGPDQMEKLLANAPEAWRKEAMNFFRNMPAGSGGPSLIDIEQETEQEYWPAEQIVQSGRAAVTFYASALQPDDAAQYPGPLAKLLGLSTDALPADAWGTLDIWAFGMSCVVDLLVKHPGIDPARISVGGFSRGGKAGSSSMIPAALVLPCPVASMVRRWVPSRQHFPIGSAKIIRSMHGKRRPFPSISTSWWPVWHHGCVT